MVALPRGGEHLGKAVLPPTARFSSAFNRKTLNLTGSTGKQKEINVTNKRAEGRLCGRKKLRVHKRAQSEQRYKINIGPWGFCSLGVGTFWWENRGWCMKKPVKVALCITTPFPLERQNRRRKASTIKLQ